MRPTHEGLHAQDIAGLIGGALGWTLPETQAFWRHLGKQYYNPDDVSANWLAATKALAAAAQEKEETR